MQNDRNADVLRRIISYCSDISEAIQRLGKDYTVFPKILFIRMPRLFVFYKLEN